MSKTYEVAKDVVDGFDNGNEISATDWVGTVITVIQQVTNLMQMCGLTPGQAASLSKNPSFLQRRLLVNRVRSVLGFRQYASHGNAIVNAMVSKGYNMSESDWQEVFEEN